MRTQEELEYEMQLVFMLIADGTIGQTEANCLLTAIENELDAVRE